MKLLIDIPEDVIDPQLREMVSRVARKEAREEMTLIAQKAAKEAADKKWGESYAKAYYEVSGRVKEALDTHFQRHSTDIITKALEEQGEVFYAALVRGLVNSPRFIKMLGEKITAVVASMFLESAKQQAKEIVKDAPSIP